MLCCALGQARPSDEGTPGIADHAVAYAQVKWSPAGDKVAVAIKPVDSPDLQLYLFTPEYPTAQRVTPRALSSIIANTFIWQSGGNGLLLNTVPKDRGPAPPAPRLPRGPVIQVWCLRDAWHRELSA